MAVHKLSFRHNANSYPQYREEVSCSCGFSGKLARPELAFSQGKNHLLHHGVVLDTPEQCKDAGLVPQTPAVEEHQEEEKKQGKDWADILKDAQTKPATTSGVRRI